MIDIMIKKMDPRMEAQKFLEYVGAKDLSKMDKAIANELQMIVKKIKTSMDNPEILMPLIAKGKMLCEHGEMAMEKGGEDMSADMSEDMSEMASEEPVEKSPMEYNAQDALNEIKAILAKVKED